MDILVEVDSESSKKQSGPHDSTEDLDVDSRFKLRDQPSHVSLISRRSNADQKGERLVNVPVIKNPKKSDNPEIESQ